MIRNSIHCLAFLLVLSFSSCEENNEPDSVLNRFKGDSGWTYQNSLESWKNIKKKNGPSYSFQVNTSSWTGVRTETTLIVVNNEVVGRNFKLFGYSDDSSNQIVLLKSFEETSSNLGSNPEGAAPMTIDEFYETCAKEYLIVDQKENSIYFEAENSGLISTCGFVPNGCMDDCFNGFRIDKFTWI